MRTLFLTESFPLFCGMTITVLSLAFFFKKWGRVITITYAIIFTALVLFYRIPERDYEKNPNAVIAASDGVIMDVHHDRKKRTCRITAFLNIFDQHLQFYPVSGRVVAVRYKKGTFHPAYLLQKSHHNERSETVIRTHRHGDVVVTQVAGQVARRIVNHSERGMAVEQCDYLGMIKLSSRVDVEFSTDFFHPVVAVGDKILAQKTILAARNQTQ